MLHINYLKFSLGAVLCQLIIAAASSGSYDIPEKYSLECNSCIFSELQETVKDELCVVEFAKNIGHNTTCKSISIVLKYDDKISEASKTYNIPKEMIQAVLFKELRMIDFRDDISDAFVDKCFDIHKRLVTSDNIDIIDKLVIIMTDTKGSSTGIGQVFPETAIKAYNWYTEKYGNSDSKTINYLNTYQRECMWRKLQDDNTCIDYIALVLKYEAECNLNIDVNSACEKDIENLFIKYNGAYYYGGEVLKYYNLFCRLETASIKSDDSQNQKTSLE